MLHLEICRQNGCSVEKSRHTGIIPAGKSKKKKNKITALKARVSGRKHRAQQKDKGKNGGVNTEANRRGGGGGGGGCDGRGDFHLPQ